MISYTEKQLKPCPVCDVLVTDDSFDRGIRFTCKPCGYVKSYPGLLQTKVSSVPIPYVDKDGVAIDPKDVKYQEYYHSNATEEAIESFNNWVDERTLSKTRNNKLEQLLTKTKIYVLNAIINDTTTSTIGVFDNTEDLNIAKEKWEGVTEVGFEFYVNEMELNIDTLSTNPEKHLSKTEMRNIKHIIS